MEVDKGKPLPLSRHTNNVPVHLSLLRHSVKKRRYSFSFYLLEWSITDTVLNTRPSKDPENRPNSHPIRVLINTGNPFPPPVLSMI